MNGPLLAPVEVAWFDQVRARLAAYQDLGIEAFLRSGYPHPDEGDRFAHYVLADLDHEPLTWG